MEILENLKMEKKKKKEKLNFTNPKNKLISEMSEKLKT